MGCLVGQVIKLRLSYYAMFGVRLYLEVKILVVSLKSQISKSPIYIKGCYAPKMMEINIAENSEHPLGWILLCNQTPGVMPKVSRSIPRYLLLSFWFFSAYILAPVTVRGILFPKQHKIVLECCLITA